MSAGIYSSLADLVALQVHARNPGLSGRQPPTSLLAGRSASRLRGRGLIFEEVRLYRPGDDVRRIDWRTSARRGEAHTRVFAEERERPIHLVVDQRLGMFFGSVAQMKSVTAAEIAALIAWQGLASGDPIGAPVSHDAGSETIAPHRQRARVLRLLGSLVRHNHALGVNRGIVPAPQQLDQALADILRHATHDALIVLISDFQGISDQTREFVRRLARHNDVVAILVHDPTMQLPTHLPNSVLSDGCDHASINLSTGDSGDVLRKLVAARSAFVDRSRPDRAIPSPATDPGGDVPRQRARALGHTRRAPP